MYYWPALRCMARFLTRHARSPPPAADAGGDTTARAAETEGGGGGGGEEGENEKKVETPEEMADALKKVCVDGFTAEASPQLAKMIVTSSHLKWHCTTVAPLICDVLYSSGQPRLCSLLMEDTACRSTAAERRFPVAS